MSVNKNKFENTKDFNSLLVSSLASIIVLYSYFENKNKSIINDLNIEKFYSELSLNLINNSEFQTFLSDVKESINKEKSLYELESKSSSSNANNEIIRTFNVLLGSSSLIEMSKNKEFSHLFGDEELYKKDSVSISISLSKSDLIQLEKSIKYFNKNSFLYKNEPELLLNKALQKAGVPRNISNEMSKIYDLSIDSSISR